MTALPSTLEVVLHGHTIGSLTRLPGQVTVLALSDEYVARDERPVLSLGLLDAYHRLRLPKPARNGEVPAFFANLLPESELRRYVARRAGVSSNDDFALLWITGDDLPGAVSLRDGQGRELPPPSHGGPHDAPPAERLLRFSLAGVQLKFSAIANAYGGLTIPAQGRDGSWIVKLPSRHLAGVPENELAMLRFASAVGIGVPETRLVDVAEIDGLPAEAAGLQGRALAVKRFDRTDAGERVHIEDFNQIYRQQPKAKYDNFAFAHVCATVYQTMGNAALLDLVGRLVFAIAIANSDMHLKNWSVIYRDGRTPELAPAYDYVCTKVYLGSSDTGLAVGSARFFSEVTLDQFGTMAQRAGVSSRMVRHAASAMVERVRDAWTTEKARVPPNVAATIDEQFRRVPLLRGGGLAPAVAEAGPRHEEVS